MYHPLKPPKNPTSVSISHPPYLQSSPFPFQERTTAVSTYFHLKHEPLKPCSIQPPPFLLCSHSHLSSLPPLPKNQQTRPKSEFEILCMPKSLKKKGKNKQIRMWIAVRLEKYTICTYLPYPTHRLECREVLVVHSPGRISLYVYVG